MKPEPRRLCSRFGRRNALGSPALKDRVQHRLTACYKGGRARDRLEATPRAGITSGFPLGAARNSGFGPRGKSACEERRLTKPSDALRRTREEAPRRTCGRRSLAQPLPDGGTLSRAVGFFWGLASFGVLLRCAKRGKIKCRILYIQKRGFRSELPWYMFCF